jgi:hypothetical protein
VYRNTVLLAPKIKVPKNVDNMFRQGMSYGKGKESANKYAKK